METELRFTHVGMQNVVCANDVVTVMMPGTTCTQRMLKKAKEKELYLDFCRGRPLKSMILMRSGHLVGSCLLPKTVMARLNDDMRNDNTQEDEEDGQEIP